MNKPIQTLTQQISARGISLDAAILCGGLGTRMGGQDKGLIKLQEQRFAQRICRTLALINPNDDVIINANRNLDRYAELSTRICSDEPESGTSPLFGLKSVLSFSNRDVVIISPCDTPFLNELSVSVLLEGLITQERDTSNLRPVALCTTSQKHPLHCALPRRFLNEIDEAIRQRHFKLTQWFDDQNTFWTQVSDEITLTNINTPEELQTVQQKL